MKMRWRKKTAEVARVNRDLKNCEKRKKGHIKTKNKVRLKQTKTICTKKQT